MIRTPTSKGVAEAAKAVAAILPPTPLLPVTINGTDCWVKAENLQPIGAFKIRGAWWALSNLEDDRVVAVSSGNHAQGIAWAAKRLGKKATIVMPHDAPQVKLDNTRKLGAEIVLYQRPGEDRDKVASGLIDAKGGTLVHAFGNPWVIEGQGTAGIEITQQLGREPSAVIACCGGGGLAGGLALACRDAKIYPVEPVGWDMVGQALAAGQIVHAAAGAPVTICDALQPTSTKQINLDLLAGRSQPGVAVTDEEVIHAQQWAFANLRMVIEPGGAAALAAALTGKVSVDPHTVIMITGGNADPVAFAQTIGTQAKEPV